MSNITQYTKNTSSRKSIINLEINAQIKSYQRKLVLLNFSRADVTEEYNDVLKKIKYLRDGLFEGQLRQVG